LTIECTQHANCYAYETHPAIANRERGFRLNVERLEIRTKEQPCMHAAAPNSHSISRPAPATIGCPPFWVDRNCGAEGKVLITIVTPIAQFAPSPHLVDETRNPPKGGRKRKSKNAMNDSMDCKANTPGGSSNGLCRFHRCAALLGSRKLNLLLWTAEAGMKRSAVELPLHQTKRALYLLHGWHGLGSAFPEY
jgi:hypothetical protein